MPLIFVFVFFGVIVSIIMRAVNASKQREAKRRREEAVMREATSGTAAPARPVRQYSRPDHPAFADDSAPAGTYRDSKPVQQKRPATAPAAAQRSKRDGEGSLHYDSGEGESAYTHTTLKSAETTLKHTVRSQTESAHYHAETSMTGFDVCDDSADTLSHDHAYDLPVQGASPIYGMNFDRDSVRNAIIFAEIIGKPRALRSAGSRR